MAARTQEGRLSGSEDFVGIPHPARIRAARDLRGLTQAEVVKRMRHPVSAAALSQIESGKSTPAHRTLGDLAEALDVPVEFFFAEWAGSDDVLDRVTYFRDLAATPAKERRRAGALAFLVTVLVGALESRLELPKARIPTFDVEPTASRDEIENIAQAVRGEWDLGNEPVPHVVETIERHGVPIARLSLGGHKVDAFSVRSEPRPLILLTDDKSNYVRSRFDAAHELGHLVMHRASDANNRSIERQAHDFAASFLLPAEVAETVLPRRIDNAAWAQLADLKRQWGMSIASLLYRANELHLLPPDSYRNAMKYMSVRGWRKTEPGDRQLGLPESPRLFDRAIQLVYDQYGESIEDIARQAYLPVRDAVELVKATRDQRPKLVV